jgi:DNA-binding transcriptional LysR family regulator
MRVEQLEHLVAVTRFGSLRRASEQLHLSQPALSESVSRLEKELGVVLIERRRSGARISSAGLELLPYLEAVLEAMARLRAAAGDQKGEERVLRVGTVSAATSTLLTPALRQLAERHPTSRVELASIRQTSINEGLLDGRLDLGLVNVLAGDDPPAALVDMPLLQGPAVVVLPQGHPFTARDSVTVDAIRGEPFVAMREGYLMHRLAVRLFGNCWPRACASTDGAEVGKALVADGAGLTVLPRFSVDGDVLERSGAITYRTIEGVDTTVSLVLRSRRAARMPAQLRDLRDILLARAGEVSGQVSGQVAGA